MEPRHRKSRATFSGCVLRPLFWFPGNTPPPHSKLAQRSQTLVLTSPGTEGKWLPR